MPINEYAAFLSEIKEVIKHTDLEYTFRMAYGGDVLPGQFFEVSIPKFGEAPISVSGIEDGIIDLTIRRVGKVTNEIFERYEGESLFMRGPYGNGFNLADYYGKELVIIAGGTGVSPVRAVVDHFANNPDVVKTMTFIAGFKTPNDILFRSDFERWSKTAGVTLTVDDAKGEPGYNIGLVTEYIPKLKVRDAASAAAIVVGPPAMMRFTTMGLLKFGFKEENIQISHERRMCCGIGKCGHCKINDVYVCLDGPIFSLSKAKALLD